MAQDQDIAQAMAEAEVAEGLPAVQVLQDKVLPEALRIRHAIVKAVEAVEGQPLLVAPGLIDKAEQEDLEL